MLIETLKQRVGKPTLYVLFLGFSPYEAQFQSYDQTGGYTNLSISKIKTVVEEMVTPFLDSNGFELVDIEYVKEGSHFFLRVFVDKEGGIDIDECGRISEFLSEQLDKNDPVTDAYFLEVSSPGAERPLKKPEDVHKAVGKHVYITTYEPIDGSKEFEGQLIAFDGEQVSVQVGKKEHVIPYAKVAGARLAIVF